MHLQPPPNARDLLPPLLACLPASFVSPQPPPALLPLLAPLLRQRITYLSGTASKDGWLPLLAWDSQRGASLPAVVEKLDLEPHPVSGELEIDEVKPARYRRLDSETLQARLEAEQFDLLPIYVWCDKDEHGGTPPGWKLSELRALEHIEDGIEWFESQSQAEDAANTHTVAVPPTNVPEKGNNDDDYWNLYDNAPTETPGQRPSGPVQRSGVNANGNRLEEADYYARYGEEVQPAMDSHDPDEDSGEFGESTLNGASVLRPEEQQTSSSNEIGKQASYLRSLQPHAEWAPHDSPVQSAMEQSTNGDKALSMPRAISPVGSHSSVDKLEERAAEMSNADFTQVAIKQHISTDIKSLYRLAKASGMNRVDFSAIVKRELDVLSILDQDE